MSNLNTKTLNGWINDDMGTAKHYVNGVLHSDFGPAEKRDNGTILYYRNGLLHRDGDEPAMISAGGSYKYARNGKYHRDGDRPAITWSKGGNAGYREEYWKDGEVYKAVQKDGTIVHFSPNCTKISSAILSNNAGPAVIRPNGDTEYWLNGTRYYTINEWESAVRLYEATLKNEEMLRNKYDSETTTTTTVKAKGTKMNKPSFTETLKSNATEAAYRVGATQATKAVKTALINVMRNKGSNEGMILSLQNFLDSEFGEALIGLCLGLALQNLPHFNEDARVQKLAEEMRVGGMATAGNAVIGEAVGHLLPALSSVLESLPEVNEKNVTRIKEENTLHQAMKESEEMEMSEVKSLRTMKA